MKKFFLTLLIIISSVPLFALEETQKWAYVKGENVNMREQPSRSGTVQWQFSTGELLPVHGQTGEWVKVEYDYGGDGWIGYINSSFVDILEWSDVTPDVLKSSFEWADGNGTVYGYLDFEQKGNQATYQYFIKNREMQEAGGNGILDSAYGDTPYHDDILYNPDSWNEQTDYTNPQALYDKKKKILIFMGLRWKQQ